MCGIYGITVKDIEQVQKMIDLSIHRGPNNQDIYHDEYVTLGHNLLSITDSSLVSKQPWSISSYVLCFNGEIYNYLDLKNNLTDCKFVTETDTEVLAYHLFKNGIDGLNNVDGMYAISWYNKQTKQLILARDNGGTKPLYYSTINNKLVFSSSLKSILSVPHISRKLDIFALKLYQDLGYVPGPLTLIENIYQLYPGQILIYDCQKQEITEKKNSVKFKLDNSSTFEPDKLSNIISTSVKRCLMGKRRIALLLSGGLDSSAILHEGSQFTQMDTFSTRFDTNETVFNDDADVALKLSKHYKSNHTELVINIQDFVDAILPTIQALELPHANINTPAYYLMYKYMSEQGIIVTLSGDGGDEIFTGYIKHTKLPTNCKSQYKHWYHNGVMQGDLHLAKRINEYMQSWYPSDLFGPDIRNNELLIECYTQLCEDYLIRNDKLGMKFSMEARFPLTTNLVRQYVLNIPYIHKITNKPFEKKNQWSQNVKILSKQTYKNKLPNFVLNKKKTGWSIPKKSWSYHPFISRKIREINSKGFHKNTNDILHLFDNHMKKRVSLFYLRLWASEFNIHT